MNLSVSWKMFAILFLFVLFGTNYGDSQTYTDLSDQQKLKSYEEYVSISLQLNKVDKKLLRAWTERFQVKQVNLSVEYRILMMKHRDHNFRTSVNKKWKDCIHTSRRNITKIEQDYNREESECLKEAISSGEEKKQAVKQLQKEVKKWRKGYRYLLSICKTNHFNDDDIASCVVEYVEKDSYNKTLQRLLFLTATSMRELLNQFDEVLQDLEECLRINLSEYLTNVRSIMKILDVCYNG